MIALENSPSFSDFYNCSNEYTNNALINLHTVGNPVNNCTGTYYEYNKTSSIVYNDKELACYEPCNALSSLSFLRSSCSDEKEYHTIDNYDLNNNDNREIPGIEDETQKIDLLTDLTSKDGISLFQYTGLSIDPILPMVPVIRILVCSLEVLENF